MTWRAFLAGCWWSHSHETHWVGTQLLCLRCWEPIPILAGTVPKGEAHAPTPVRGTPKIKAVTDKVTPIKKRA